jgi:hypothetical protein
MKSKKNKETVIGIFKLFITVFLLHSLAFSQSLKETRLSLVHEKISMGDLLKDIEQQSDFYFSFSPDDFDERFLKVRFLNRPLSYILDQVFEDQFSYHKNGYEIIVFKNREPNAKEDLAAEENVREETETDEPPAVLPKEILRIDTVYQVLRDTLLLKDTVYVIDTVLIRDTIYRQKIVKNAHKGNVSFKGTLIDDARPVFYLDIFYAPIVGSTVFDGGNAQLRSLYSEAFEEKFSYAAGINGGVVKNGFIAETGLALRKVRNGFSYTYTKPEESFYEVDTLDSYYTLTGSDTSWYYVTDSSMQVIPGYEEFYQNTNEYTFLDVPLNIGYQLRINNIDLEFKAGLSLAFLLSKQGYYIAAEALYPVKEIKNLDSKLGVNGGISLAGVYHINKRIGLSGQLNMRTALSDPFRDSYPVEADRSEFILRFGIRARL